MWMFKLHVFFHRRAFPQTSVDYTCYAIGCCCSPVCYVFQACDRVCCVERHKICIVSMGFLLHNLLSVQLFLFFFNVWTNQSKLIIKHPLKKTLCKTEREAQTQKWSIILPVTALDLLLLAKLAPISNTDLFLTITDVNILYTLFWSVTEINRHWQWFR